jgi:hypothetical protein
VVLGGKGFRDFPHSFQRGEFRIGSRGGEAIGADAIKADSTSFNFVLQVLERTSYTAVVFMPSLLQDETSFNGPAEIVFGIVEKIKIQTAESQSFHTPGKLIFQKLRMNAVFQSICVKYQFPERASLAFAFLAELIILPLKIAHLGHYHHRLSGNVA